jgi:hypothetical protein
LKAMKKATYLLIGIFFLALQSGHAQKGQTTEPETVAPILVKDPKTQCTYRYHYYPNLCGYYDAKANKYILKIDGQWQRVTEIPNGYMGYSLNNKMNVIITDYDDDDVIQFIKVHKKKYPYNFHQKSRDVSLAR